MQPLEIHAESRRGGVTGNPEQIAGAIFLIV